MDVAEDTIQQEMELHEVYEIPNLPIKLAELSYLKRLVLRDAACVRSVATFHRKFLLNLLRSARVGKEYTNAVKYCRCVECEESAPPRSAHKTSLPNRITTHKTSLPSWYEFKYVLGMDVLEILDAEGARYQVLRSCLGTCFQLKEVVRVGAGQPTSAKCLETINDRWIS